MNRSTRRLATALAFALLGLGAARPAERAVAGAFPRLDEPATAAPELPRTLAEACRRAARAERESVALCDRLPEEEPEVRATLELLREASATRHLPPLERWAALR